MEQRLDALDPKRGVGGGRRAEIVVDEDPVGERDALRRLELPAQRRRALVAEAGEGESGAPARSGSEGREFRLRAVVQSGVEVGCIGAQRAQPGVMNKNRLVRLRVGVARRCRRRDPFELAVGTRGFAAGARLFQDTTISVDASPPNCRCSPQTGSAAGAAPLEVLVGPQTASA